MGEGRWEGGVGGKGAFGCSPAQLVGGAGRILLSLSLVPVGAAGFSAGNKQPQELLPPLTPGSLCLPSQKGVLVRARGPASCYHQVPASFCSPELSLFGLVCLFVCLEMDLESIGNTTLQNVEIGLQGL